jgi:acyl-coenzyme A synthetase/AMP-(fatty) acid ligase
MGHRIETGEIEAFALRVESVNLAACVAAEGAGELRLFYTGDAEEKDVTAALAAYLPRYYLPSRVIKLDVLPATPGGKIDRRALAKE